jgi:hypothetical protein
MQKQAGLDPELAPWRSRLGSAVLEGSSMNQQFILERAEIRVDIEVTAMLVGRHDKLGVERAITENVSPHGVRVISTSEWMIDDTILVALPAAHFTAVARIAYCDDLGQGRFGTGLEFIGSSEPLEVSVLITALESPDVWLQGAGPGKFTSN